MSTKSRTKSPTIRISKRSKLEASFLFVRHVFLFSPEDGEITCYPDSAATDTALARRTKLAEELIQLLSNDPSHDVHYDLHVRIDSDPTTMLNAELTMTVAWLSPETPHHSAIFWIDGRSESIELETCQITDREIALYFLQRADRSFNGDLAETSHIIRRFLQIDTVQTALQAS
jgi:hypothetical protein